MSTILDFLPGRWSPSSPRTAGVYVYQRLAAAPMSGRIFMLSARAQAIVDDETRRAIRGGLRIEQHEGRGAMRFDVSLPEPTDIDVGSLRARLEALGPGHVVVLEQ